jgi:hypothetical protein
LTSRQCPECGTPFLPSDYEFTTNSVQFQCPHCNQSYYGTGAKGHLVPPAFTCIGCDKAIHMNQMVLIPTEGVDEEETNVRRSPWLDRKRIGFFKGWMRTVGRAMVGPRELMRVTPMQSSAADAWWFGLLSHFTVALLCMSLFMIMPIIFGVMGMFGGGGVWSGMMGMATGLAVMVVGLVAAGALAIAVWGFLIHGILRMTGETSSGIGRTYQAMCYSSACVAPAAVPCLGIYLYPVGWVWWAVSAALMVREAQKISTGRAIAAVSVPAVVGIAGVIGIFSYWVIQLNSWSTQTMSQIPNAEVQAVVDGVLAYGKNNEGAGPAHAIRLVLGEQLDEYDFVTAGSSTDLSDVPVETLTLEEFAAADEAERETAAGACEAGLPAETIAYRLGDFVFTHHGLDLNEADGDLWVVVRWEDPDSNPGIGRTRTTTRGPGFAVTTTPIGLVWAGSASGEVRSIPASLFDNEMNRQNELRAKHGLAALPHPRDVTHAAPAVKPGPAEAAPAEN